MVGIYWQSICEGEGITAARNFLFRLIMAIGFDFFANGGETGLHATTEQHAEVYAAVL